QIRKVLQVIRACRVVAKVVLDDPNRIEAELFGQQRETNLFVPHLRIRHSAEVVLKNLQQAELHAALLRLLPYRMTRTLIQSTSGWIMGQLIPNRSIIADRGTLKLETRCPQRVYR